MELLVVVQLPADPLRFSSNKTGSTDCSPSYVEYRSIVSPAQRLFLDAVAVTLGPDNNEKLILSSTLQPFAEVIVIK